MRRIVGNERAGELAARTAWAPTVIEYAGGGGPAARLALPTWLRWLAGGSDAPGAQAREAGLEDIKRQISGLLASHVIGMPHHDMRVYLRVLCATDVSTIQEARFDLFDMLCRYHGESIALQRLRDIDRLMG
ncbi:MAG: hypothetical protein V4757_14795 [Pseudomonadota bacterium]